jgi:protein subunit release factor A
MNNRIFTAMTVFVMNRDFAYSQLRVTDHRTVFGWQKVERNLK